MNISLYICSLHCSGVNQRLWFREWQMTLVFPHVFFFIPIFNFMKRISSTDHHLEQYLSVSYISFTLTVRVTPIPNFLYFSYHHRNSKKFVSNISLTKNLPFIVKWCTKFQASLQILPKCGHDKWTLKFLFQHTLEYIWYSLYLWLMKDT